MYLRPRLAVTQYVTCSTAASPSPSGLPSGTCVCSPEDKLAIHKAAHACAVGNMLRSLRAPLPVSFSWYGGACTRASEQIGLGGGPTSQVP